MQNVTMLRQLRFDAVQEMSKLAGSTKPADVARWKELDVEQKRLESEIRESETKSLLNSMSARVDAQRPNIGGDAHQEINSEGTPLERLLASREYKRAFFDDFIRRGNIGPILSEQRTYTPLGSVGGADGASLVPTGFQRELEIRLKALSGMRQVARILPTTTGNPLQWPTADDTTNNGRWLTENTQVSQTNPTFSSMTLNSYLASSDQVLIPIQLLQDSGVDVEAVLVELFGQRIARLTNLAYTSGAGSTQPTGILDATNGIPGYNSGSQIVTAIGANENSGNDADTDLNSIGTTDIGELIAKVDPIYRDGAVFMGNASTIDRLRTQKDKYGRTLWSVSLALGAPDKIYGYPIAFNQSQAGIGASNFSLIFGRFDKYIIRDVTGFTVVRFNEKYMDSHQIGFQAFLRTEGKLIQPAAFSVLQHPAS